MKSQDLPLDSPNRRRLPALLRKAWYGLNQAFRRRIAHTGLTPDQFTALRTLNEGDPNGLTQKDLTAAMASDPNTIASLIERMEQSGWITKKRHERDKRAHQIRISPNGMEKYLMIRDIALDLQTEVFGQIPEDRRERFLEDLSGIADACNLAAINSPKKSPRLARKFLEPTLLEDTHPDVTKLNAPSTAA